MSREAQHIENILLVSASVIYRKIIKNIFSELTPDAVLTYETTESPVLYELQRLQADLVIIDTAAVIKAEELLFGINFACLDIPAILLCSRDEFEHYDAGNDADIAKLVTEEKLHFTVKPIDKSYDDNLRIIKKQLKLVLMKLHSSEHNGLKNDKNEPLRLANDKADDKKYSVLLIAASTGGPAAIEKIFSALPRKLDLPVLIVQHMPAVFTKNWAENLRRQFSLDISEASNGDKLQDGKIFIAPGGHHMLIDREKRIVLNDGEAVNGVKPSADVLFFSAAERFKDEKVLAVILTGMGSDGTEGVRALKRSCRCFCIAQDEESCTVYGMPRAVVEAALHDRIANIDSISGLISKLLKAEPSEGGI